MNYDPKRWAPLRERALRRDKYRCRECARFGRRVQAERVHHAWPSEEFPELRWELWNLVSLCKSCHDRMHDRASGRLTPLGLYWLRRTRPPQETAEEG